MMEDEKKHSIAHYTTHTKSFAKHKLHKQKRHVFNTSKYITL